MSKSTKVLSSSFVVGAFLFLGGASETLAENVDSCRDAVVVDLDTSVLVAGHEPFEAQSFNLFVPKPGYLVLDVASTAPSRVEPTIGHFGRACRGNDEADPLQWYLTSMLVPDEELEPVDVERALLERVPLTIDRQATVGLR